VEILSTDSADDVAAKTQAALDAVADFDVSVSGDTITVTNVRGGAVSPAVDGNIGGNFAVSILTAGTDSDLNGGDYFLISSTEGDYYVWFYCGG
jgi:hypothetical protein